MKTAWFAACAALGLSAAGAAFAQDATITNARIMVGDGPVIEEGHILIRDGLIEVVGTGAPPEEAGAVIDAAGMTAAPGFIEGHKHIATGEGAAEMAADMIENGFTTVLSGGGSGDGALELAARIEAGEIVGPRVIASERINIGGTPEEARQAIRDMAAKGITHTGEIAVTPVPGATGHELEVLRAALDEGDKQGVQVNVHAVSTAAMMDATEAGVRRQVHLPNKDFMGYDDAQRIADTGTIVLDAISFGSPIINVFEEDNTPRFRTGQAWPESIAGAERDAEGRALGVEGPHAMLNARRVWDASGGAALGFGSDQNYGVRNVFEHELDAFRVMFSAQDMVRILTVNTAAYIGMEDEIGTLEPGKRADIVLLDGNPFEDFHDFLNAAVVLKDGEVVVDKR